MKKFLFSLFLVTFGFLFFNVNDVYAMTEMEVDKIINTSFKSESSKKTDSSFAKSPGSCGYYIGVENNKTYFYFRLPPSSSLDLGGTKFTGSTDVLNYYKYEINQTSELNWWFTEEDVNKYIIKDTYTEVVVSENGSFEANKAAMEANTYDIGRDDNDTLNNIIVCVSDFEYDYSLTEEADDGLGNKYTSVYTLRRDIRSAQFVINSEGKVEYFDKNALGYFTMTQGTLKGTHGRVQSCNQCAFDLLIQNSGLIINADLQCSGKLTDSSDTHWVAYDEKAAELGSHTGGGKHSDGNGVYATSASNQVKFYKELTGENWNCIVGKDTSIGSDKVESSESDADMIVRFGNKDIKDMDKKELLAMLKSFYNNDYFVIMGIRKGDANGPSGYRGGHVVLFAGCNTDTIYVNDSTPGSIADFTNGDSYKTDCPVMWISVIKTSSTSTKKLCGGGQVKITTNDKIVADSLGVSSTLLEKSIDSELAIASYCKLMETDLENILDGVNRDNLTGDQLDSLHTWEELNADSSRQGGVLYWIRVIIMWMGIALIIWAVLLYVGFWFDRANNFIDISFVTILTLGKLTTSDTDEEYTYGDKDSKGIKTINSRILTKICILSILVGVLIVSGTLYSLIAKLVNIVTSFISKGG